MKPTLRRLTPVLAIFVSALWIAHIGRLLACPFCSATSQTLSEELAASKVSVVAKLVKAAPAIKPSADDPTGFGSADPDSGKALFAVQEVLRGNEHTDDLEEIEVVYFGEFEENKSFLINGVAGQPIDWTTPLPLSPRAVEYVKQLGTLPEKGPDRLEFFLGHLEDEDPLLAQDAYDEFARAPYSEIIAMSDRMDRTRLTDWIEDPEVGPTRRRLYLTLLGVCGEQEDVAMLESLLRYDYQQMKPAIGSMISVLGSRGSAFGTTIVDELVRADVRRKRQCLDALIAAYLKLKGPEGLPLVEQMFLTNPSAEYTHVYATIMALRFHGEESKEIPRERLQQSLRLVLDNPEIADQVIPDLARWEDWSILDRLTAMFKESEQDAWIRQPVISYLLAAAEQPAEVGERANEAIAELEKIDPKGVERARSFMQFGLLASRGAKDNAQRNTDEPVGTESTTTVAQETIPATIESTPEVPAPAEKTLSPQSEKSANPGSDAEAATQSSGEKPAQTKLAVSDPPESVANTVAPNRLMIIGVPVVAGLLLMGIFALLLRGSSLHSSGDGS